MVKKFVIKPWMIIVVSVVVIGGVALFFVLNKGDDKSTPTDKSNESVKKSFSPQQYNDYVTKTQEKIKKAQKAEAVCKQQTNPKTGKNYKSCEEKELAEAVDEEVEKEKEKEEKKTKKPMTPARFKVLRKKYMNKAKQLVSNKRKKSIPYCKAGGKKGDTNQNGYKMMGYGCKECEPGYFLDEDGKCHGSAAECNDPRHIADEKGKLIHDDMADKLLKEKKQKLKCICAHIHPGANSSMYRYKDGICQRKFKTEKGLEFKDFFKGGYKDVYASNEEKKKAVNDKKLHRDFLNDPNFYQEEGEKDEEAKDWQGNKIIWYKPDFTIKRDMSVYSDEEAANAKIIKELKKKGVVQGKFYKKNGDKIKETTFSDKDKSVFYINGPSIGDKDCNGWCHGGLCHPNDKVSNKNIGRYCGGSGWFAESNVKDLTNEQKQQLAKRNKAIEKVFTKSNFVITPECVF
jgi:hypothetical protein